MSVVNVRSATSAADAIEYALYGTGKLKNQHLRAGTTRAAALTCSLDSPQEFVRLAHDIARAKSRRVEVYSYVQAFAPDEFNVDDKDDIKRVHDLGVKLAEKMHSAHYVVVTHTDANGGHLHNHIYIANEDNLTGKALTRFRSWTRGLHQLNDQLMKEENCEVLPSPERARDDWDTRRGTFAPGGFEQTLGDKIMEVLSDATVRDRASFERALEAEGIKLAETARDGLTYKMRRANGKLGRRKASSLCDEFTAKNVEEIFNYRNTQNQEDREMKLIDKLQQESVHEDAQEEIQETAPVPQVEETEEEKSTALAEFTEEQKRELARIYAHEESQMHAIERENDMSYGQMNGMTNTMFEFELGKLADAWGVTEIDTDAALNAVKEIKEKNAKAKNSQRGNGEKSEKPVARTAKRSERRSTEQKQQQPAQQPYKQQQKQAEPLAPEEQAYDMALERAFKVLESGTNNFAVIIASWVSLVRAEHALIRYREQPTPEEMREIEQRDEEEYQTLTRGEIAEAREELERRVERDLRKQYKRGIRQIRKQQRKQQKQQTQVQQEDTLMLTPEQQALHDAYKMNLAKTKPSSEMEL